MPQDELWAASARPVGFRLDYVHHQTGSEDKHVIALGPTWSKEPSGRRGGANLVVPDCALWQIPAIFEAAFGQFLGGDPRHVGTVALATLRGVRDQYADGVLG